MCIRGLLAVLDRVHVLPVHRTGDPEPNLTPDESVAPASVPGVENHNPPQHVVLNRGGRRERPGVKRCTREVGHAACRER